MSRNDFQERPLSPGTYIVLGVDRGGIYGHHAAWLQLGLQVMILEKQSHVKSCSPRARVHLRAEATSSLQKLLSLSPTKLVASRSFGNSILQTMIGQMYWKWSEWWLVSHRMYQEPERCRNRGWWFVSWMAPTFQAWKEWCQISMPSIALANANPVAGGEFLGFPRPKGHVGSLG